MSKPIRLFKLVTGELVLGKFDEEANMLEDVAIIQVVPTQQGVQMMKYHGTEKVNLQIRNTHMYAIQN